MPGYSSTKNLLNNSNCVDMLGKTELPNVFLKTNMIVPNTPALHRVPVTPIPKVTDNSNKIQHGDPGSAVSDNSTDICNDLKYIMLKDINSSNPEVWGPGFWFSLHNGALQYPDLPAPLWKERMKNFIVGIPVMLPCEKCSQHASAYIESQYQNLDEIVKNKQNLFNFFCNFHNIVNERLNKPTMSITEAYKLYSNNFNVTKLKMN